MKYTPYDFQQNLIDRTAKNLSENKNTLIQLPTRGGKSIILCHFAELGYKNNKPVLIIAHTEILISQISDDLTDSGIPHGIIKAGHPESNDIIQIASVQTLHKRKHKIPKDYFKLAIWDETHRILARTFLEVREYFSNSKWIGLSATPIRPSTEEGFDDVFDIMEIGPTKIELIKRGFLVPTLVASPIPDMLSGLEKKGNDYTKLSMEKALKEKFIHGEYVQHYLEYGVKENGEMMKGLVFVPTIAFGKEVSENFNKNGVSAVEISSKDNKKARAEKLATYYGGKYDLLISIGLFLEGFTIRECEIIISLRPTMSPIVWLQMAGRGSMTCEGKDFLIFVDCTNTMFQLGHMDTPYPWSLQGETKTDRAIRLNQISLSIVRCDKCRWSYNASVNPDKCPRCGALREVHGRSIKTIDGKLQLISSSEWQDYELQKRWEAEQEYIAEQKKLQEKQALQAEVKNASSREALQAIAKSRGYKQGWVEYKMRGKGLARNRHRVNSMF